MILEAVKQNVTQNLYMQRSTNIQVDDSSVSFLGHFQDASEKIRTADKVRLDHLDEEKQECEYFSMAEDGIISYKGAVFVCDYDRNELLLGDCSDRSNCITIALSKGGSLVVNKDNVEELKDAITMFTPEDRLLIMKAIMINKRAKEILEEIKDQSFVIGGKSYTVKEWDKLIEQFDRTEDVIKEQLREEIEKQEELMENKYEIEY